MRRQIVAALCSAIAFAGMNAAAQGRPAAPSGRGAPGQAAPPSRPIHVDLPPEGDESTEETPEQTPPEESAPDETEGAEVATPPDGKKGTVKIKGGHEEAPGQVHKVVKGDTLWDLSKTYLGTPWYWPKVWSYNPQIANPHWIYPGNEVRFFSNGADGEEGPSRVEVGGAATDSNSPDAIDNLVGSEEGVRISGKIGYTPPKTIRLRQLAFVTSRELDEAGNIDSSFRENEMLAVPDTVYLKFKVKGGTTVGFSAYISLVTLNEKKNVIFQLVTDQGSTIDSNTAHKQKLDCALQLARSVALDFNNALTGVLGHSTLLLSKIEANHPMRNSLVEIGRYQVPLERYWI